MAGSALVLATAAAQADESGHERGARPPVHGMARNGGEHHGFRQHDVRRFDPGERERWVGGRWNNTCFGGRCGWWWQAGGQWYFYDRPVYPYPLVVSPIDYVEPMAVMPAPAPILMTPAPVMVAPAPAVQLPPPQPAAPPAAPVRPPPKFLYYCDNPAGYYPAVANCNTPFREVALPPSN